MAIYVKNPEQTRYLYEMLQNFIPYVTTTKPIVINLIEKKTRKTKQTMRKKEKNNIPSVVREKGVNDK